MSLNICCSCASQLVTKNPPDRVVMNIICMLQGSCSNKSTYHSNQQLTYKSIDLLMLIIVDYICIGWIWPLCERIVNHTLLQMITE